MECITYSRLEEINTQIGDLDWLQDALDNISKRLNWMIDRHKGNRIEEHLKEMFDYIGDAHFTERTRLQEALKSEYREIESGVNHDRTQEYD